MTVFYTCLSEWDLCCSCYQIALLFTFLVRIVICPLRFLLKNDVRFVFTPIYCVGDSCNILFTYTDVQDDFNIRWCARRLTVTQRFSHVEREVLNRAKPPSSPPVFSRICVALVSCVMFYGPLFVILSFFFWPLYVLRFTTFIKKKKTIKKKTGITLMRIAHKYTLIIESWAKN